jgi:pilus assembly protein CpaC
MTNHINRSTAVFKKGKIMNRRLLRSVLFAACAALPLAILPVRPAAAQSVMRPANTITLSIGRGQLVTVPGAMADIFVAQQGIADVKIKSQRQLYLFGMSAGETTVYASNRAGDIIWSANVRVGSNIESVDQMLQLAMPDAKITATTIGSSTYLLTGTVASPEDAAEAQRLVEAFVGSDSKKVISRLKMATPLQVNLQVRFAEVSRSLVHEISANVTTQDTSGGIGFGFGRGATSGTISGTGSAFRNTAPGVIRGGDTNGLPLLDASANYGLPAGTINLPFDPTTGQFHLPGVGGAFARNATGQSAIALAGRLFGVDMLGGLNLGERVGLVSTLSQPNLTAMSGESAEFLAGGEFPILISQGLGQSSVEFKSYGVKLKYTPTVLSNGRISIRVSPEVSEISSQGAISVNGTTVPALTTRRAETTVELGSGQSFMIAGLMGTNNQNSIEKTPGVGDMPVLGALFRSTNYQKGETELVIVITPYLVNPVDAADIKLPTDGLQQPDELQRVLGNKLTDGKSETLRPMPTAATGNGVKPDVSLIAPRPTADERISRKEKNAADQQAPAPGFNLR